MCECFDAVDCVSLDSRSAGGDETIFFFRGLAGRRRVLAGGPRVCFPGAVVERVGGLLLGIEYGSKPSMQATVAGVRLGERNKQTDFLSPLARFASFVFWISHEIPKQVDLKKEEADTFRALALVER